MELPKTCGWVEVITGCMYSGKTEELIRRVRRVQIAKQRVTVFKPKLDDRYHNDNVTSHDGSKTNAKPVVDSQLLAKWVDDRAEVIAIDEAQFFDDGLVEVVTHLADLGRRVIVAWLDLDYQGNPFGPMPRLLAMAESVTKLTAICTVCGDVACRTERTTGGTSQVEVGSYGQYEARCRRCWTTPQERNDESE